MSPLSTLPDLCLLAILDRVPVHDLYHTVPLVCKRWNNLQATACHRRKTLILVESIDQLAHILDVRHIDLLKYALKDDGTPFQDDTIPTHFHNSCLVCPLEYSSANLIPYLRMTELFPNVQTLKIIQYYLPAYDLCSVQVLLNQWASSITNLRLTIHIDEPENEDDDNDRFNRTIQDGINSIMFVINNRMIQLKHLSLSIRTPNLYRRGGIRPDLNVISTLETIRYLSCGFVDQRDDNEPLNDIELYGLNATALLDISIDNSANLDRLLKLSPKLTKKFTQIDLIDKINLGNLEKFNRFCCRFSSLTVLDILIEHSYWKVIGALTNLRQLIHLAMRIDLESQNIDQQEQQETPQLSSVVALSLFIETKSHHDFGALDLPATMPNLQVILIRHDSPQCTECGYGPVTLEDLKLLEIFDRPSIEQMQDCMKRARCSLHGLEKLRKLNVNMMPNTSMNIDVDYEEEYAMQMTKDELLDELDVFYDCV